MRMIFRDRIEAGRLLAEKLAHYANRKDVLVLGLPRGGVPVAYEVAAALRAPLDVFVVRKLGVPGHEELAMGAIASGGVRVLNDSVVRSLHITEDILETATRREQHELERREHAYRDDLPAADVRDRLVVLVDDGVATGSTMYAAIAALKKMGARHIVVAVPTIASETFHKMRREVDELIAVITPDEFYGVGQWYEDFSQTTDEEVRALLAKADMLPAGDSP